MIIHTILRWSVMHVLLIAPVGCATSAVWQEPARTTMYNPHITGALRDDPQDPTRPTAVIVEYMAAIGNDLDHNHYYRVAVPLNQRGLPPAFFRYSGKERTPTAIERDLPTSQRDAIASYRFAKEAFLQGNRAIHEATYHKFKPVKISDPDTTIRLYDWKIAAFGLRESGEPAVEIGPSNDYRILADAHVLLLPYEQPRPASELAPATIFAWMATPFTVAFDIATFPAQFAWRVTHC